MTNRDLIARALIDADSTMHGYAQIHLDAKCGAAEAILTALAAAGRVIVDADDAIWLNALRGAGVDNWEGIEHAIDLRDEMLAAAGGG